MLLVGAPKIGKSWLVLAVALAAAEGGRALGIEVPQRPVLYLALEDGHRRLQDRCRRLLADDPIPEQFQYITMIEPGRVADTIAAWLNWHQEPPPLVILDTLGGSCRRPSSASRPTSVTTGSGRPSSASWTTFRG